MAGEARLLATSGDSTEGVPSTTHHLVPSKKEIDDFTERAARGDPHCQLYLGALYSDPDNELRDFELVVFWLAKAAECGLADAQGRLGHCYEIGLGGPRFRHGR